MAIGRALEAGGHRADVDDRAMTLVQHGRQDGADHPVHGGDIEREGAVPVFVGALERGPVMDIARRVDQHIEGAVRAHQLKDRRAIGHIQGAGLDTGDRGQVGQAGGIDIRGQNGGALVREGQADGPTDPGRRGGDQGAFSGKSTAHDNVSRP